MSLLPIPVPFLSCAARLGSSSKGCLISLFFRERRHTYGAAHLHQHSMKVTLVIRKTHLAWPSLPLIFRTRSANSWYSSADRDSGSILKNGFPFRPALAQDRSPMNGRKDFILKGSL
jgi:hypothetical protein